MESETEKVLAFLDTLPLERRLTLARLRTMISRVAPGAVELLAHDVPTYDLKGPLFQLGVEKAYLALYVCEPNILDQFRERLGNLEIGTSCIRFRNLDDFPPDTLKEILQSAVASRTGKSFRRPEAVHRPGPGKPGREGRGPRQGRSGDRNGKGRRRSPNSRGGGRPSRPKGQ